MSKAQTIPDTPQNTLPTLLNSIDARHNKIDIYKAIQLRNQGNSYSDIAKIYNCTRQHVHQTLAPYIDRNKHVQRYKHDRADVLADLQLEILGSLDKECITKAPFVSRITAMAILYDKERLERGESTENVSVIVTAINDLRARRKQKPAITID